MIRLFPRLRNLALAALAAAFAMPAAAQTAPAAPTGLTGWESATRIVTVQWDDPDDSTITKYQWRNTSLSGSFPAWTDISGSGATTTTATTTTAFPNIWNRRIQVRACAGTTCGNASEVRVDVGQVPIIDVSITSTPRAGDTYTVGETISVAVTWAAWASPDNRGIQLTFSIGANNRTVETTARPRNSGTSAARRGTVTWHYTVVAQDVDADGISIGPYPIGLAGRMDFYGGIVTGAGNVGQHQIRNSANHKVNGALTVPAAPTGLTAAEGSGEVTLSWADPQLSSLGGYEVRYAPATDSYPETWTAVPGDASTTEYTVTSLTNETEYKFQLRAKNGVGDGAAAEVRATPTAAPLVSDVSFAGAPVARDTYGAGEAVFVDVEFTAPVTVTGSPRLALTVGGNQRQAQMQSVTDSTIRFRYIVVAADRDTDGIGIAANALTPNGATITSAGGDVARLGLRTNAFTANASHKVNGSTATVPTVSAVSITSAPVGGGNTYGGGERIEVEVAFADAVPIIVTGGPRLLIRLAGGPVRATLRRTEGQSLHFGYVVQTGDLDPDGISVAALDLIGGGAIRSHAGTIASLSLGTHAINNAGGHRVVGSSATQPTVTGASITSSPVSGDTYGAGEAIRLEVAFSLDVVVTGSPQATLTIDPGARLSPASYQSVSGNTLTFRYVVQSADRDSNGVSLLALALNSGTIRSLVGANASLALGSHAITNDGDHKTDGRTATVPQVSLVAFESTPVSGDTYGAGEAISVNIGFTTPVTTTGSPRLALAVGSRTRYAALAGGGSTSGLTFSYTAAALDVDTDGVGIGASALELNGGAIRSLAAANALLPLGNLAVANAVDHKVDGRTTAPLVSALSVTSSPASGDTYEAGETISVQVGFTLVVSVEGTPQLTLAVGRNQRQARYASGSGTTALTFSYTAQAADVDTDGIGIAAGALTLAGGRIRSAAGANAALALGSNTITAATGHKVDGRTTVPTVTGVTVSSDAGSDSTYAGGETIAVQVSFQIPVTVTGRPQLTLGVGIAFLPAAYASGSGTRTLTFRYEVQARDHDADGISVAANALALNSGTIRSGGGTNATLALGTHALGNQASHKVDGRTTAPTVTDVTIVSDPGLDDTYVANDRIDVEVSFQLVVTVTGTPQLALQIGSTARQATYASGTGTKTLTFRYTAQTTDVDANGISIAATALTLNAGTIRSATTTNAALALGAHALGNQAGHKVDGAQVAGAPSGLTATPAGTGAVGLQWNNPRNTAITGYQYRQARNGSWTPWILIFGSGASTTSYTVPGLTNGANYEFEVRALVGSATGSASAAEAVPAVVYITGVQITSRPTNGTAYVAGEVIVVTLTFSHNDLEVDSFSRGANPTVTLNIGDNQRAASYVHQGNRAAYTLEFRYTVAANDADADGISIGPQALNLPGTTFINSYAGGGFASPTIGRHRIVDAPSHRVVQRTTGSAPAKPAGFSAAAGNAQATLTWTDPRDASISHYEFRQALASAAFSGWQRIPGSSATTTTHTVGSLANGTQYKFQIRANNAHGASPASDEARATPADLPTVTAVRFASGPVSGDTYGAGEAVLVDVVFGSAIRVTGEPRLALMIGTNSRQAAKASVATNSIRFRYVVQTSDVDADGIGIVASALTLGAGTIVGAVSGTAARLALGSHAWTANASHKVNGATGTAPTVSAVAIVSAPVSGDTYGAGEAIEAAVSFGALVPIRVTGSPQLTLRIGSQNRLASLASTSGQTLRFRYVVQSADADTNGIGVSALGLNSGTINSTTGTAANLALGSHAIADHADHKVNGATATAPTVSGVAVASTPVSGDTYGAGERIEAQVTFAIGVSVTGSPQLALGIGTQSRTATYVRLEGQTLVFEYTVVAADADSNGLSVGASALTLNSGTITSVANAAANLGLSAHAITDAASHKVDGASATAPFVSAVYIVSTPLARRRYLRPRRDHRSGRGVRRRGGHPRHRQPAAGAQRWRAVAHRGLRFRHRPGAALRLQRPARGRRRQRYRRRGERP